MRSKFVLAPMVAAAALVLGTAALAATAADPGVTQTSVLLGGTSPLTGSASAYASVARGADAYFKYQNGRGGAGGRQITYKYVDDAYNPAQTVQATRQLVEQDKVFAIFNALGTEHNLATRDYLKAQGVPQLFVASGATTFGSDADEYPGTIGFQPSYQAEGVIYGRYLARTRPGAKVAVLFQNDDYGKDLLLGLKRGLARSKVKVIAAQAYEVTSPDVGSQIAKLKGSGADVLALFATPKFAIQGYVYANKLGWKPKLTINNAVSSASNIMTLASEGGQNKVVNGSISIVFLKDPTDPKWAKDATMKLYRSIMKRYRVGRERERRVPRVRHGGRVDDDRVAEEGRQEPHACRSREGRLGHEPAEEPVPAARDRDQDERDRPLPTGADAAAALVERQLALLRRHLVPEGELEQSVSGSPAGEPDTPGVSAFRLTPAVRPAAPTRRPQGRRVCSEFRSEETARAGTESTRPLRACATSSPTFCRPRSTSS